MASRFDSDSEEEFSDDGHNDGNGHSHDDDDDEPHSTRNLYQIKTDAVNVIIETKRADLLEVQAQRNERDSQRGSWRRGVLAATRERLAKSGLSTAASKNVAFDGKLTSHESAMEQKLEAMRRGIIAHEQKWKDKVLRHGVDVDGKPLPGFSRKEAGAAASGSANVRSGSAPHASRAGAQLDASSRGRQQASESSSERNPLASRDRSSMKPFPKPAVMSGVSLSASRGGSAGASQSTAGGRSQSGGRGARKPNGNAQHSDRSVAQMAAKDETRKRRMQQERAQMLSRLKTSVQQAGSPTQSGKNSRSVSPSDRSTSNFGSGSVSPMDSDSPTPSPMSRSALYSNSPPRINTRKDKNMTVSQLMSSNVGNIEPYAMRRNLDETQGQGRSRAGASFRTSTLR